MPVYLAAFEEEGEEGLGSKRILWYLERYHGIKTSESTVTRTLVRHGENRLTKTA